MTSFFVVVSKLFMLMDFAKLLAQPMILAVNRLKVETDTSISMEFDYMLLSALL